MNAPMPGPSADAEHRTISAAAAREMLAGLQEAVVTGDPETRRALLKSVIARLQDVLVSDTPV